MVAQTNHQLTKCNGNKIDTMIYLLMGKTNTAKTPSSDFKVTTHENLLLLQQAVISKGITLPYTNL